MEKIRLFNDDKRETYNGFASAYDLRLAQFLYPLVDEAASQGVSLRDLHYVLQAAVTDVILNKLVDWIADEDKSKSICGRETAKK